MGVLLGVGGNALHDHFFPVEVHHVHAQQRRLGVPGVKEPGGIELQRHFVLAQPGVGALLLGRHGNVKQGNPGQPRQFVLHPHQPLIAVADELLRPAAAHNAEAPGQTIELANQLNDHQADFPESTVGSPVAVPAQLAACLLHGGNGTGSGDTGAGAAGGDVPVAGDLLQFIHLAVKHRQIHPAESGGLNGKNAVLSQAPLHMNEVLTQIGIFRLVDAAVAADKVPGTGIDQQIHENRLVAPVDVLLSALCHIDVAKAAGGALGAKQGVKDKGILPMVIPAPLSKAGLIFRGEQHVVPHKFAVMQHGAPALHPLVVPVHHSAFSRGVHPVVILIAAGYLLRRSQLVPEKWILGNQRFVVLHFHMEYIFRALDVGDAAFPKQVQHIHLPYRNVAQSIEPPGIPEHAIDAGAGFQLVVIDFIVYLLKFRLLQYHRQHRPQKGGLAPVTFLPGQHIGAGEIVHGIGVLVGNGVKQPAGAGLYLCLAMPPHTFPVPHLVPLGVVHHPALQVGLALLVAVEGGTGHANLRCPNGQPFSNFHLIISIPGRLLTAVICSFGMSRKSFMGEAL